MRARSRGGGGGGGGRKRRAAPCLWMQLWFGKLVEAWDLGVSGRLGSPEPGRLWDGKAGAAPECAPQPPEAGRLRAAARLKFAALPERGR